MASPIQQEWLKAYSDRGVVLDDSHNCTMYSLKLSTIMVIDDAGRGLPCGKNF